MTLRSAARMAALVLSFGAVMSCADDSYETTDLSTRLEVSPLFAGMKNLAPPVQYTATIGGAPVTVTWESSDTSIAKVSPTGLVTPSDVNEGFTAITATVTANPAKKRSVSLTVTPLFFPLTSGVARTGIAGKIGDELYYRILVPAGKDSLKITMTNGPNGSGDLDMYVRYNAPPAYGAGNWVCRPYAAGNNETCVMAAPAAGYWYVWLDVYAEAKDVTLTARIYP